MKVETVTIVTENGNVLINKSDYNEEIHTLVGESKDAFLVSKEGKKFFVVDANGEKVEDEKFNKTGYGDEAAAWAAIMAAASSE